MEKVIGVISSKQLRHQLKTSIELLVKKNVNSESLPTTQRLRYTGVHRVDTIIGRGIGMGFIVKQLFCSGENGH